MQYNRNTWTPRIGEGLNKYTDSISGKTLQLTPAPDSIIEPGTPFTADWMNNIEQGLANASAAANIWIASQVTAVNEEAFQYDLTIANYIPAVGNVIVFQAPLDAGESFLFTINGAGPSSGTWYQVAFADLSVDVTGAWVGTAMLNVTISSVMGETGNTLAFFRSGGGGSKEVVPSYTGNSQIFGDGTKGYIEMYDSGILTFNTDVTVDIFLVGGGGGGGNRSSNGGSSSYPDYGGGGGGGGGYTNTLRGISFSGETEITVTIGAGGTAAATGGTTSVGEYSAAGGRGGQTSTSGGNGGAGGSGGGCGGAGNDNGYGITGNSGGTNGSDGTDGYYNSGGAGQGTSTYEFLDTQLRLFAGGGGGGGGHAETSSSDRDGNGGGGGAGGGGAGGYSAYRAAAATSGQANTGGGGGGAAGYRQTTPAAGGSGVAIIRWGDWTATA